VSMQSLRAATDELSRFTQPTKHDPSVSELGEKPLRLAISVFNKASV
jgi:hypothetical protein